MLMQVNTEKLRCELINILLYWVETDVIRRTKDRKKPRSHESPEYKYLLQDVVQYKVDYCSITALKILS